jgi:hypothetical protein
MLPRFTLTSRDPERILFLSLKRSEAFLPEEKGVESMMDPYSMLDLSDEELEAVTGGTGITINVNPTVNVSTAITTAVTDQVGVVVVASSKLINSTVSVSQKAQTQAQSIIASFH